MFLSIKNKLRLLFYKDKESYCIFYDILGFMPHHINLYKQALLHKSLSLKDNEGHTLNNERLEFLGDAVLDAIVADILYNQFHGKREGFLTNTRSKIVQRNTLNKVGKQIGLDKLIRYSQNSTGSHNSSLCGNAFEALVGAIYLDRGYRTCKHFMEDKILNELIDINLMAHKEVNFKSRLIEWSQKNKIPIEFTLREESTDEQGNPFFNMEVCIEGECVSNGTGYSKKESQQNAAKAAMKRIRNNSQLFDHLRTIPQERMAALKAETETDEIENQTIDEEIFAITANSEETLTQEKIEAPVE